MRLSTIVLKDLLRRKTKLIVAILSIAISTAAIVAVITTFSAAQEQLYSDAKAYGANIIVNPKTEAIPIIVGTQNVGSIYAGENYIEEKEIPLIRTIKNKANIFAVAPKLYGTVAIESKQAVLMGINVSEEKRAKPWWTLEGRWIEGEGEVLIGSKIAKNFNLSPNSIVKAVQGGREYELTVAGVLSPTGANVDAFIIASMSDAQKILGKQGLVNSIEVSALCNNCPVEEIARQINELIPAIEATPITQIVKGEEMVLERTQSSAMAISIITLIVSTLTVGAIMLASVNEKIKEIGIMRAIGASDRHLISMLLVESTIIGGAGGLLGFTTGSVASLFVAPVLVKVSVSPFWALLPVAIVLATCISMVSALIPARKALSVDPAVVLRSV